MPDSDLGAVKQDSLSRVDLEVVSCSAEDAYAEALANVKETPKMAQEVIPISDGQQQAIDYYANVRTNVWHLQVICEMLQLNYRVRFFLPGL